MKIMIRKDGEGYLAEVRGHPHLFAWGSTRVEAKAELKNVAEMMLDKSLQNEVARQGGQKWGTLSL